MKSVVAGAKLHRSVDHISSRYGSMQESDERVDGGLLLLQQIEKSHAEAIVSRPVSYVQSFVLVNRIPKRRIDANVDLAAALLWSVG